MTVDQALRARLDDLFAAIDANDTERFLGFLTAEASFRFGSAPVAEGQDAIRAAVNGFFASIDRCSHNLTRVVLEDGAAICEGAVTYTRLDGSQVTLPFANFMELDGALISNYKIYSDAGPLYS